MTIFAGYLDYTENPNGALKGARLSAGQLYIVVELDDGRLLAKNSGGAFVPVDGSLDTLPVYQGKLLAITNEVIVFGEFVPASLGITNQTFNIYIAYALAEEPSNLILQHQTNHGTH